MPTPEEEATRRKREAEAKRDTQDPHRQAISTTLRDGMAKEQTNTEPARPAGFDERMKVYQQEQSDAEKREAVLAESRRLHPEGLTFDDHMKAALHAEKEAAARDAAAEAGEQQAAAEREARADKAREVEAEREDARTKDTGASEKLKATEHDAAQEVTHRSYAALRAELDGAAHMQAQEDRTNRDVHEHQAAHGRYAELRAATPERDRPEQEQGDFRQRQAAAQERADRPPREASEARQSRANSTDGAAPDRDGPEP